MQPRWRRDRRTIIERGAYIGSGCKLVAPVRIGEGATVGAGSTITRDVPPAKLTLARARQVTIENWRGPRTPADTRMSDLRICRLGCSGVMPSTNGSCRRLRSARGLELHGVCSRDARQRLRQPLTAWQLSRLDRRGGHAAGRDVDVVYVATPTGCTRDHGGRVLAAGKHLWCEKPLTTQPAERR